MQGELDMPLYDYFCKACAARSTLLVKVGETPICPKCQSDRMDKLFSAFAIHGKRPKEEGMSSNDEKKVGGHVHTTSCASGCGGAAKAQDLLKKYLD